MILDLITVPISQGLSGLLQSWAIFLSRRISTNCIGSRVALHSQYRQRHLLKAECGDLSSIRIDIFDPGAAEYLPI